MPDRYFPTAELVTASGALLIWTLTRIAELVQNRRRRKSDAEKYVMALFAEIDFNTRDMEVFLEVSASVDAVIDKVKSDRKFIPHITDARHISIYAQGISNIHYIGKEHMGQLVYFYGLLEKLKNQVAGIYLPSFTLISRNGRAQTIREIIDIAEEIKDVGLDLLSELKSSYTDLKLERTIRRKQSAARSDEQPKANAETIHSDLDRVDAKHNSSPNTHKKNSILLISAPAAKLQLHRK